MKPGTYRIKVTQEHIDLGKPGICDHCPIALAVREMCDSPSLHVDVSPRAMEIWEVEHPEAPLLLGFLPEEAVRFVREFDLGYTVDPFEFDIDFLG